MHPSGTDIITQPAAPPPAAPTALDRTITTVEQLAALGPMAAAG